MTGHREFLGWPQGMKPGEHLNGIAVELHILAALDLNDLTFRNAVGAHDIGVGLRAYDHGTCFLGDIRNIGDVIPMAVTNQNVIQATPGKKREAALAAPVTRLALKMSRREILRPCRCCPCKCQSASTKHMACLPLIPRWLLNCRPGLAGSTNAFD